jgi:hypothetical protein
MMASEHRRTAVFPAAFGLLLLLTALAGCAAKPASGPLLDLARTPQDLAAFLDPATAQAPLLSREESLEAASRARGAFFAPWSRAEPVHPRDDLYWGFAKYANRITWGESYQPRGSWWVQRLEQNADSATYPNLLQPAIATSHASLRVLPTIEPVFEEPTEPGEGFPFDYNQNSLVWAGTPLFVIHASADGQWLLCEAPFAAGWVRAGELAFVDQAFMDRYREAELLAVVEESVPVRGAGGAFLFSGRIGTLLPLAGEAGHEAGEADEALAPARRADGTAELVRVSLPAGAAVRWPLALTPGNVAALGNRMMGEPYGWGGLFERRDCSSTLMDLFAPFGLRLPRNSAQQAKAGERIDISGLNTRERKERLRSLPPFLTLVGKRGHIMLYVGQRDGEPMVFHSVWGVRTTTKGPLPGRRIIGSTVITTLEPGAELPELAPGALLLETISSYTCLGPRGCAGGTPEP